MTSGRKADGRTVKSVLSEALAIAAAGTFLGFVANWLSPRGLALTRDFFFLANQPTATNSLVTANPSPAPDGTNIPSAFAVLESQLRAVGLHLADSNLVTQLFHDPRYQQDLVVFIDAREPGPYGEGHIPGAYELDYYHPDSYLATLMPLCASADRVVVYCNGGDCEDSKHAAQLLGSIGISRDKLLVYGGGIREWESNNMPIELRERKSGLLKGRPGNPHKP